MCGPEALAPLGPGPRPLLLALWCMAAYGEVGESSPLPEPWCTRPWPTARARTRAMRLREAARGMPGSAGERVNGVKGSAGEYRYEGK